MADVTTVTRVEAPPTLTMELDGRTVAARPKALAIDVAIAGSVSRTTMVLTFENPHDRELEGELVFPLPEGASVCGYGLDVDGEIVDASLVEKRKARAVFEEEIRKNVDPGLLEQVRGNLYRSRVWPLPAEGTRTVKVEFVAPLAVVDGIARYELPLRFDTPLRDVSDDQTQAFTAWSGLLAPSGGGLPEPADRFRLRVTVAKGETRPAFPDAENLDFVEGDDAWVAEFRRPDELPDRIAVGLPLARGSVAVDRLGEESFFRVDVRMEDPEPPTAAPPGTVGLVWDASLSRAWSDKGRDFALLRDLLGRWQDVDVDLYVLRDDLMGPRRFHVVAGDGEALLESLVDLPYDGGTRLGSVDLAGRSFDLLLLFGDGLGTLGADLPPDLACPVFAVASDPSANRPLMRHLAERTGGALLDLNRLRPETAAGIVATDRLRLLGVEVDETAVADVVPPGPRCLEDGTVAVGGRLLAEETEIVLRFGRSGGETERRTYRLRRRDAGSTGLVARLWARQRVDDLSLFEERHREELLELGRRFHIVTPGASLLVLETLEQHLEHDIPPAESRVEMRREYDRLAIERREDEERRRAGKLDQVIGWWNDRVEWWEREFEPLSSSPPADDSHPARDGGGEEGSLDEILGSSTRMARMAEPDMPESEMACCDDLLAPPPPMASGALSEEEEFEESAGRTAASIAVSPWIPEAPYLEDLRTAGEAGDYEAYLDLRATHGRSPSYYLDCADHFFRTERRELGVRVLGNVAELDLSSPALLRIVGYKLETEGELERAAEVFERVLAERPDEPQSHRDLALVLERLGDDRRAAELLWNVVTGEWDERFPEIETIALMELNRILAATLRRGDEGLAAALGIDERLVRLLDHDLRVLLAWDADLTDVDLWVTEPTGEKAYYSNDRTAQGGRVSRDFTQGYGPEEYVLRRGVPGVYRIQANYYGSGQQAFTGPATILATVFTNYGRSDEERRTLTVRVEEVRDVVDVGEVTLGE